jgi:5-methylcytosine-specific restriction protein A
VGCPELVEYGYCEKHKREDSAIRYDKERGTAAQRGYNKRWQKARMSFLKRHPLCVECEVRGLLRPAQVVDHIIPHKGNKQLFWDRDNWQALCKACHDEKTAKGE